MQLKSGNTWQDALLTPVNILLIGIVDAKNTLHVERLFIWGSGMLITRSIEQSFFEICYVLQFVKNWKLCRQVAAAASTPDPNSVEAVAAVKQLVLSQIDKKLKDLREEGGIDQ